MLRNLSTAKKAIIALIIANLIWGAAAPIYKWSLMSIPPFSLAILRFSIAAIILFPFTWGKFRIERKDYLKVFLMGFSGVTINITFFFLGLKYADSINAPIIGSSGPIFLIFAGAIFLKDRIKRRTILGALIGLLGVAIIVVLPSIQRGLDTSFMGNIFFIFAMFAGVANAVILKELTLTYKAVTLVFWTFVIGTIGFIPMLVVQQKSTAFLPVINTQVIVGVVFGAVLSSVAAYVLQTWAIKKMPVEDVGLFAYMDPVIAILIAFPLLGEVPNINFFIGSILVFLGIYIAERRIHWHPIGKLKVKN